jgi:carbon storage regulator
VLIISRRVEQNVVLDLGSKGTAAIKVLKIEGNQVRIGITAPKELAILRGEISQKAEIEVTEEVV